MRILTLAGQSNIKLKSKHHQNLKMTLLSKIVRQFYFVLFKKILSLILLLSMVDCIKRIRLQTFQNKILILFVERSNTLKFPFNIFDIINLIRVYEMKNLRNLFFKNVPQNHRELKHYAAEYQVPIGTYGVKITPENQ